MSPPSWKTPSVLLITVPPHFEAAALKASTADAIVLHVQQGDSPLDDIAAARPDLPLIVLEDVDEQGALPLIARGADYVLPTSASMPEIARAARFAIARRSRHDRRPVSTQVAAPFADAPQLQAIARLAGGIAHEFNNLLTVVEASVEQLVQGLPEQSGLRQAAEGIGTAAREATVLTRQLLAFGRQQTLIPAAIDVNRLVADASPVLRSTLGDGVLLTTELARDLAHVRVDRDQLMEVLSNLALTAREAMPGGGTFTVTTDMHAVTDEERRHRPWLPGGRFVRVRVTDTGLGMEEQALPHLFEPFFTANRTTRGKGLAMSSVYGVVKQSGGFIWADSRVNKGTTVTIILPPLEVATVTRHEKPEKPARSAVRVLLVEDTDAVRQTLTGMLEWHGFTVTPASTAEEALEFARTLRFDILLTDVALPGKNGPELALEFRQISSGTPVIFMSGYSANSIDPHDLDTPRAFLQKPFPVQTLVDRIHEMLAWARERDRQPNRSESRG
ncbi:MAG TPA: ATP-binding protein [Vicinamibacterales bacterium]|nr:ATP-binding protein [Vicinamibacterales bacterium]